MHAFPKKDDLKIMLSNALGWDLERVAGGSNDEELVFNLLRWAESREQIKELFDAAKRSNPDNPKLRDF
ncbi:effector-associated domain EAD1-containing protein [Scytonema hofmannii]|uniref:effector-associated domain EAD1-containing protein n=1 Tax=Scytonema hofmannii TaxID=34078 RepID=UPI00234EE086|nr:effector-associated domain EAD1-containing protein [Scytonema hofmannii]